MRMPQIASSLRIAVLMALLMAGGHRAGAQEVRLEVGGGWAIPSSSVDMTATIEGGGEMAQVQQSVDPGSGTHGYASVRFVWTLSSNFDLGVGVRVQQAQMDGDTGELLGVCDDCTFSNDPDGQIRAASFEGRIALTSVGRITPYFLIGLGVVNTSVDGVRVDLPSGGQAERVRFSEVDVTDAGGDVGFGARMPFLGGLAVNAEIRATGSLPGAKESAVTTFPFSLGLSYGF